MVFPSLTVEFFELMAFIMFLPAFGLGAMIYIGLELGSFFEIPMGSSCYNILRGVNPLLQLIFTFMQMYFIFINARVRSDPVTFSVDANF